MLLIPFEHLGCYMTTENIKTQQQQNPGLQEVNSVLSVLCLMQGLVSSSM